MKPKFSMTIKENIFIAKRNLVDYIYNSAKLEGCNVTFPETKTIIDGVNVGDVSLSDVQTILNMRDAWKFVLSNIEKPFDLDFICRVNDFVSRSESLQWGVLRTGKVGISGTDYTPDIPIKEVVINKLSELSKDKSATEYAIDFFLWACRSQLFWDGNKRTSTICANKILISAGEGILTVRDEDILEFNKLLLEYYNTNDASSIKLWLYKNCIDGIDLRQVEDEAESENEDNNPQLTM